MVRMGKPRPFIVAALLMIVVMAAAQTQRQREAVSVRGYPGQANVFRLQGRMFVNVQDLASNHKRLAHL